MNFFLNKLRVVLGMVILSSLLFVACTKDDPVSPPVITDGYSSGIFIINEGPFQNGTGTISYMNRNGSDLSHEIFQKANSLVPLGNLVQSMNIIDDKAYIVVNNANKIEIVTLKTFQSVYTIEDIPSPRYIIEAGDNKAYVSCWDNTVKIINTENYKVDGFINVGTGPEKMLLDDQKLWVLNQGGLGIDSTISIIDTQTDQIINTIQVYAKPTGIQQGLNGLIWVMCSGKGWNGFPGADDTEGHLVCIDPDDYLFIEDIAFPSSSEHPEKLEVDNSRNLLFYSYTDGIYKFNMNSNMLETEAFIKRPSMFYGLGFDIAGDVIYASDPLDYVQNGMIYRYNPEYGSVIDSLEAGIIPGEFFFTE